MDVFYDEITGDSDDEGSNEGNEEDNEGIEEESEEEDEEAVDSGDHNVINCILEEDSPTVSPRIAARSTHPKRAAKAPFTATTTTTTTTTSSAVVTSRLPAFSIPPETSSEYRAYALQGDLPDKECFICFEYFREGQMVARVDCMCIFHQSCIDQWYARKRCCPFHMLDQ